MLGCLVAMLAGALMALIHAVFSIHLRANQVVSGTGINFLALGITGYFFIAHYGNNGTPSNISQVPNVKLPLIQHVGFFGAAIGNTNLLTWIGLLLVPIMTCSCSGPNGGFACAPSARSRGRRTRSGSR